MEENLKNKMIKVTHDLLEIMADIQNNKLQNEQFALDFVDSLNKISVKF